MKRFKMFIIYTIMLFLVTYISKSSTFEYEKTNEFILDGKKYSSWILTLEKEKYVKTVSKKFTIIERRINDNNYRISFDSGERWQPYVPLLNNEIKFDLFPNPANSELNIANIRENISGFTIEIINFQGKKVCKSCMKADISFDISELETGIYILQLTTNDFKKGSAIFLKE